MRISLENLCLEKIINNFDIYNSAYSTTKNATLKLHFEFLQRVYSLEIINKLNDKFLLKAEYMDFVINKHLKILDSNWFKYCTWDTITNKIAESGGGFQKASFQNGQPWEEVICHLPNLKSITYPDFCNNKALSYIAEYCKNIETINIQNSKEVSNVGIIYLCCNENGEAPCPVLKEINLQLTCVQMDGMEYLLKNLPSLERTDFEELPELLYSVHKNDINEIDKVKSYNITSLNLCHIFDLSIFTDILQVCVSVCPHLKSLQCNVSTEKHMNLISQLSEVENLNLHCMNESPLCIDDFLKLKGSKLLCLKLNNFSVSVSTLARKCLQLSSLHIYKNTFVHNDDDFILMRSLKELYFDEFIMTDICINQPYIQRLLSSPNLKSLGFKFSERLHSNLTNLHLRCCNIINLETSPYNAVLNFIKDILMTCSSLQFLDLDEFDEYYTFDEMHELVLFADTLPNRPKLAYKSFMDDYMDDFDSYFYNNYDDEIDDYLEYENYDFDYDSDEEDYDDFSI